jgi:hypothetical protein
MEQTWNKRLTHDDDVIKAYIEKQGDKVPPEVLKDILRVLKKYIKTKLQQKQDLSILDIDCLGTFKKRYTIADIEDPEKIEKGKVALEKILYHGFKDYKLRHIIHFVENTYIHTEESIRDREDRRLAWRRDRDMKKHNFNIKKVNFEKDFNNSEKSL